MTLTHPAILTLEIEGCKSEREVVYHFEYEPSEDGGNVLYASSVRLLMVMYHFEDDYGCKDSMNVKPLLDKYHVAELEQFLRGFVEQPEMV